MEIKEKEKELLALIALLGFVAGLDLFLAFLIKELTFLFCEKCMKSEKNGFLQCTTWKKAVLDTEMLGNARK